MPRLRRVATYAAQNATHVGHRGAGGGDTTHAGHCGVRGVRCPDYGGGGARESGMCRICGFHQG